MIELLFLRKLKRATSELAQMKQKVQQLEFEKETWEKNKYSSTDISHNWKVDFNVDFYETCVILINENGICVKADCSKCPFSKSNHKKYIYCYDGLKCDNEVEDCSITIQREAMKYLNRHSQQYHKLKGDREVDGTQPNVFSDMIDTEKKEFHETCLEITKNNGRCDGIKCDMCPFSSGNSKVSCICEDSSYSNNFEPDEVDLKLYQSAHTFLYWNWRSK